MDHIIHQSEKAPVGFNQLDEDKQALVIHLFLCECELVSDRIGSGRFPWVLKIIRVRPLSGGVIPYIGNDGLCLDLIIISFAYNRIIK